MSQEQPKKPIKVNLPIDVWKCEDLKALISKEVRAHVKDVDIAKRLEQALGDAVVYGDGGGGGHVGVA
jgi:hypothetical protein